MKRHVQFDLIRGLSALAVCASHLRNGVLVDYGEVLEPNVAISVFYYLTGLGHQSVIVFFVLSGFFVGGSVLQRKEQFIWSSYMTARLTRLWVVLIPSLFFTLGIDVIIEQMSSEILTGTFAEIWNSGPKKDFDSSIKTFLGNVVFLQTVIVPVYGTNQPLWSLAYEFWYYILFPLILISLGVIKTRKKLDRSLAVIFLAGASLLLPPELTLCGTIWLLGVISWRIPSQNKRKTVQLILAVGIFSLALFISKKGLYSVFVSDLLVGLAFAVLIYLLKNVNNVKSIKLKNTAFFLSDISYTLYLFHFPLVIAIAGVIYKGKQMQPTLEGLIHFIIWLLVIIFLCIVPWWLFEKQTPKVRNILSLKSRN